VRKILATFDDDKGNPDILLRDLNWRAMVKRAVKYPIEEWKLGKEPNRSFNGDQVVEDLKRARIRIEVIHIKSNNVYGAWLMDALYTEARCAINISREDVEYVAVPNEAYKAIPVTWPEDSGLEGWNEENTGNIWEAWAGTLWLHHQKTGLSSIRRLVFCALMTGGDAKIPLSKYLMENGKEDWVDEETKTKIQQLRTWNPAEDAPGFGDTSEEEDSEEEEERRREVTLRSNEETRQRKHVEEEAGRRKVPRQSAETRNRAETRVPPLPDKGAYGEEPLGKMQRPTEKDFTHYSYNQPPRM
jgi:hypothetical protein